MSGPTKGSCRRVVVGVSGSPGSITALHRATEEARLRDAELWAVLAWKPIDDLTRRSHSLPSPAADYPSVAVERLRGILDTAFGAVPPGIPVAGVAVCGTTGAALVDIARHPRDVLVVGTGRGGFLRRSLRPSVARHCLAHAACPVLTVPPSPLQADLTAARRRNIWRIRLDARELAD